MSEVAVAKKPTFPKNSVKNKKFSKFHKNTGSNKNNSEDNYYPLAKELRPSFGDKIARI